ncbi:MAG: hybrid sensor histidine kinase/response regulator [Verrucomicrobiota bacterium]|nr:hybrid sensor histidine kinase/response regulator [Verrucomicrobiota bacterium]
MNTPRLLLIGPNLAEDGALHALIGQEQWQYTASASAEEALMLITAKKPDLVVVELPVADFDGAELCTLLTREMSLPVVAVVNAGDEYEEARAWASGVVDCTVRHLSPELLVIRVSLRLREAELRATASQQAKHLESFAHNVAHDIKNPLSTLLGCSETLLDVDSPFGPDDQREMISIIDEAGLRMNNIVDELLVVNSLRSDTYRTETVDSFASLQGSLRRTKAYLRDISAEVYAPEALPEVLGQPQWVEEVWKTLLCKVIQCGEAPLQIIIEQTEAVEGLVGFHIVYNGSENHGDNPMNHFEAPFSLNAIRTKGRGLGLPTVRSMVERMGGCVSQDRFEDGRWRLYFALPTA